MKNSNNNLKILGILFLVEFGLLTLTFVLVFGLVAFSSILATVNSNNPDPNAIALSSGIIVGIGLVGLIFTMPLGLAGWKLVKNKPNARFWGVLASVISIPIMCPFGLVIGILGFVFLFGNEGKPNYEPPRRPVNDPNRW